MVRTPGAKNKPKKDDDLIKELTKRGYNVVKAAIGGGDPITKGKKVAQAVAGNPQPRDEHGHFLKRNRDNPGADNPGADRMTLEIETPAAADNGGVIPCQCGNPACGAILEGEVSPCPHCGVVLTWE